MQIKPGYQCGKTKSKWRERQRRRELQRRMMTLVVLKRRFLAPVCLLICLLFQSVEGEDIQRHRSCHPHLNRFHKPANMLVRIYRNAPRPQIHFPGGWLNFIGIDDGFRSRIRFAQHLQRLQQMAGNHLHFCLLPTPMYLPSPQQ